MVQSTSTGVGRTTNIPARESVSSDVIKRPRPIPVWFLRRIFQIRMAGIKLSHIDSTTQRGKGKGSQVYSSRGKINMWIVCALTHSRSLILPPSLIHSCLLIFPPSLIHSCLPIFPPSLIHFHITCLPATSCHEYTFIHSAPFFLYINKNKQRKVYLPGGESNPGLPRDRRGYSPLYYRGVKEKGQMCGFIPAYSGAGLGLAG